MKWTKLTLGLISFLLFSFQLQAQKDYTAEADAAYMNYSFYQAIELYKKAYSKEKKNTEKKRILFRIGMSYYELQDNAQAENWLKKAVLAGYPDPEAQYYLADAIRKQARFDEALEEFTKYQKENPSDPRAAAGVKSCELAQEWIDNPTRYAVEPEPLLNSKQYDFSPTWAGKRLDEVIFTSTREGSTGNEIDPNTGENFSALWYSKRDKKGKWMVPTLLDEVINTPESNEGSSTMDYRYKTLYFTRCESKKNKTLGCEIYKAREQGRSWMEPEMIEIKKPDTSVVGHPSIGFKDEYLFFASDMPGGKGGKDIWLIKYNKKEKKWSDPINIDGVNTDGDEMFPFIHPDGRLFFASNGHPGMGGLDIFVAKRSGKTDKWGEVENMKYPINSAGNDFGILFESGAERGFFASDRDGGRGGDDIWSFRIPPLKFIIDGVVTNIETGEPIPGATIKLVGTDGSNVEVTTDELGYYEFDTKQDSDERYVNEATSYTIDVSKEKYLNAKGQETTVGVEQSTRFKHDFKLQPFKEKGLEFPEVVYALAKWELLVNEQFNSRDSLDYLYQLLIDNPKIVIELQAHTDTRGSDQANQVLSQKRAQSCVEYLVEKGIDADRLVPRGYGETLPRISDEEIAAMPTEEEKEAAHQKNRRTEFGILRDDFVPKPKEEETPEGEEGSAPSEEGGGEGGDEAPEGEGDE